MSYDPSSTQAEAFRSLGVNVEFASPKKSLHTLLVLNADPKESKTTIAVNLEIVNSQQGKRVMFLDGDFKHPHLQGLFGMQEQAKIVNLFEKEADLKSLGRSVDGVIGMTLIASGAMTEPLTTWQSGEKWQELLIKLQKQADLVIIDGPSVEATSAQILASKVDAVLLLVKLGETRADLAASTLKKFQFVGAKVAGVVLYSTPYWTNHLQIFHRGRINRKGEHQKANSKLDGTTIPLS